MKSPEWLKKAIFYEIYPQSFFDTNNDGIGDIKGMIEKLPYIQSIGFNAIWMNPCFESTFYDAGYDITNYKKVAPRYGSNADLIRLFKKCHEMGIKIILDLVPGHTSIKHPWFKKSCLAKTNPYSNRYIWTKEMWNCPKDVNWIKGISQREGSVAVNFYSIQPALNYGFYLIEHPNEEKVTDQGPSSTINAMIDVCRYWLSKGCDGFRVDMAGWLVKRDIDYKGTKMVWNKIIPTIKKDYPDCAFISEWNVPLQDLDCGFDADFLLMDERTPNNIKLSRGEHPFFRFEEDKPDMVEYIKDYEILMNKADQEGHYLAMISGNHDLIRISQWLNIEELKSFYYYLLTCRCLPFIYYGDEIGMKYDKKTKSVEGGYARTGSRNPMCWLEDKKNLGFSNSNKTYIECFKDNKITVSSQLKNKASLLNEVISAISFKKEHKAFDNDATQIFLEGINQNVLAYQRQKEDETIYCYFNPSPKKKEISTLGKTIIRSNKKAKINKNILILPAKSYVFIK